MNLRGGVFLKENEFYLGRANTHRPELGSPLLSNHFVLFSREENVRRYKEWLERKISQNNEKIVAELENLYQASKRGDIGLACWCWVPEGTVQCHCEVVKEILERVDDEIPLEQ